MIPSNVNEVNGHAPSLVVKGLQLFKGDQNNENLIKLGHTRLAQVDLSDLKKIVLFLSGKSTFYITQMDSPSQYPLLLFKPGG